MNIIVRPFSSAPLWFSFSCHCTSSFFSFSTSPPHSWATPIPHAPTSQSVQCSNITFSFTQQLIISFLNPPSPRHPTLMVSPNIIHISSFKTLASNMLWDTYFSHKKSKFLKTAISTSGIDSLAMTAVKRNISILLEIIQPACFGAGCYIEMATSYH